MEENETINYLDLSINRKTNNVDLNTVKPALNGPFIKRNLS